MRISDAKSLIQTEKLTIQSDVPYDFDRDACMFSVVTPCHNNTDLVRLFLAGLAAQEVDFPFEVILVDNNSIEGDINSVYEYYLNKLNITLVRQPLLQHPMAVCRARNIGLALARHSWVINIDADCVLPPYFLKNMNKNIDDLGSKNILIAGLRRFVSRDTLSERAIIERLVDFGSLDEVLSPANYYYRGDRRLPGIRTLAGSSHPCAYFHSCNMTYQRDVARKVNGYDEIFDGCWGYEDTDFAHRMIVEAGAAPIFRENIEVYHLDAPDAGRQNRFNKRTNRNWQIITSRIPGLEDFKRRRYQKISEEIVV